MSDENHQLPKTPSKKTKIGRPTKFNELQLKQIKKLTEIGSTDFEISEFLGIDEKTYINWKQSRPAFFQLLKEAKEVADRKVELSLYNRANGVTRKKQVLDQGGNLVWLEEELPPDPTSMIFWLKNRRRDLWKDKQEVEHSGEIKHIAVTVEQKQRSIKVEEIKTIDHEDSDD